MNMKQWRLLFLACFLLRPLDASLDGRVNRLFVGTSYTLTNNAFVRGDVRMTGVLGALPGTTIVWGGDDVFLGNNGGFFGGFGTSGGQFLDLGYSVSYMTTIILEKPFITPGSIYGGYIAKSNGKNPGIMRLGFPSFGDRVGIDGDIIFDLQGNTAYAQSGLYTNGPFLGAAYQFTSNQTSTLRLRNGVMIGTNDGIWMGHGGFGTYFFNEALPFFINLNSAVRHTLILENITFLFSESMTFSNIDVVIDNGTTTFGAPPGAHVNFHGSVIINDYGTLTAGPRVTLNLKPTSTSTDYFDIKPRGKLLLSSNTLTFSTPLHILRTLAGSNAYPRLVIDGTSTLRYTGSGPDNGIYLGGGTNLTYTCDTVLELMPSAILRLDNVKLVNNNVVL